jgi:two-component system, sensor histidine kinase and response regulator
MRKPTAPKVLVAEDNPVSRQMTVRMLAKMGIEADVAENGSQSVEKALSGSYDLILMDVQMPVMGGLEATRTLRLSGVHTPIVAMTASAVGEDREQCLDAGMTDYVAKPLDHETLKQLLRASCGAEEAREPQTALLHPAGENRSVVPPPDSAYAEIGTETDSRHADSFLDRSAQALGMAPEEYRELAEEFIGDVELRLNALEAAVSDNDGERSRQIAHAIKGGAADMLLEHMAAVAARIEASAKKGDLGGCADEVDLLRSMLERFRCDALGTRPEMNRPI